MYKSITKLISSGPMDFKWTAEDKARLEKALVVMKRPRPMERAELLPHHFRELVNELNRCALEFHYHQSLRERLKGVVSEYVNIK